MVAPSAYRLFIAVHLSEAALRAVETLQKRLSALNRSSVIRWTAVSSIHITLKFLGAVSDQQLEPIKAALRQSAVGQREFDLALQGVGGFPAAKNPRIVWAGLGGQVEALVALRDAVETHIAPLGFPTEARPFSPHVTIGRQKDRMSGGQVREFGEGLHAAAAQESAGVRWTVHGVSLMHSDVRPDGTVYTSLLDVPLVTG